jgi:Xaa-Pro aminopeptidase
VPETHEARRGRLRAALADSGVDAVLVTGLANVRYLSGFSGSNGALLVTLDGSVLSSDFRYRTQVADEAPDLELLEARECDRALAARAASTGVGRLGFEAHHVTVEAHGDLASAAEGVELVPVGHPVEELRRVKDDGEIDALRAACGVGDRALAALLPTLRPGLTERQVARRLEALMLDDGAEALAFETIVAAGPNSAVPHHQPTDRPLAAGDLLKLDFGARVDGYHADMTRTVVLAPVADWQRELYDVVRSAQRAGRHALRPGAGLREVDEEARSVVGAAGHADRFGHGLGHGVGLEIHEAPFMGPTATGTLDAGSPVTVEPGVYLPGRGGVRIEDTLVVREGGPELLTTSTKELLVLG